MQIDRQNWRMYDHPLYLMAYLRKVLVLLSCSSLKLKDQAGTFDMLIDAHLTLRKKNSFWNDTLWRKAFFGLIILEGICHYMLARQRRWFVAIHARKGIQFWWTELSQITKTHLSLGSSPEVAWTPFVFVLQWCVISLPFSKGIGVAAHVETEIRYNR